MTESITLDLNFRVLSPEHKIFVVFPGEGYFLYPIFVAQHRIFPELPGLDLIPGRPIEDQPDLIAKVARARQIRRWHNSDKTIDRPSRKLADYENVRKTRALSQTLGVACFTSLKS
jgi:hypothetical protein